MSTIEKAKDVFETIVEDLKQTDNKILGSDTIKVLIKDAENVFSKLDSDDKKTLSNRYETLINRLKTRRKKLGGSKAISGNAKGGSISKLKAGGFPDLSGDGKITKKDVLMGRGVVKKQRGGEVNGLKKMGMKVGGLAGRLAQRGYGKARR